MHPFDLMIALSIACVVGFTLSIYEREVASLVIGHFVAATLGAFSGSWFAVHHFPGAGKLGLIFGGFAIALSGVAIWRWAWMSWQARRA